MSGAVDALGDNHPMETVAHPESGLWKATLTAPDLDLVETPWGHCRIHALAVTNDDEGRPWDDEMDDLDPTAPSALKLHFDLDYIVREVQSGPPRGIEFWVAPATLVFSCVWGIVGSLRSVCMPLELTNLRQIPSWHDWPVDEPCWHLEGREMDLRFQALTYTLYVRRPPRLGHRVLWMDERGGISFDPHPFA
ncbi:hypothetical protein Misp04_29410 [Micromonospora sp. NBRC 101691]|nr:hypothetical protein Misp04_29410 [Micromonospora sp. NBRC 101691]